MAEPITLPTLPPVAERQSPPAGASPGAKSLKLVIIATHPIQYQVPWFQALAKQPGLEVEVFYAILPDEQQQGIGFGVSFQWDIPLLDGYKWQVLENTARHPGLGRFSGTRTPGIRAALAASRPDAVIITGWQSLALLQALLACMRLRIPAIIRAESNALRIRRWWVRLLHRALLSRFSAFLCIGKANRDFYLSYGVSPNRLFPTHYFVDNGRIDAQQRALSASRDTLRAQWGITLEKTCFLFAGKLQEKKRILDLLAALKIATAARADLHLLVAGSGEQMEAARALAHAGRLPVTFAGFLNQTEITRAYVAADCLVLPSDFGETWGLVVNEAMVCGLPAIVSDRVGCGPDLVAPDQTGLVFPFGDVPALADCLLRIAADPARRQAMGARARDRVAAYSVEAAVQGTLAAASSLVPATARAADSVGAAIR